MKEIVVGKDRVAVGDLIGKGGEGNVFSLPGLSGQAAKVYDVALRAKREEKVRAMVREGLASQTNLIAFPRDIITDIRGNFLGFVMRLVSGYRPVHELYGPKSRLVHFQKSDYRFVIRAALNLARAVGSVHQTGCVIGDLNHSGVLVSPDATVALIDADSFQFRRDGITYPCVVGVPDFTPPELHGVNLESVERIAAHDHFGLAIAVFQLLFMGRHPYAGRYSGPDISIGESIAQNRFAFSVKRRLDTRTNPPPGALTLDLFPETVSGAFERAFGLMPAMRPSALDWVDALHKLEGALSRCARVKTHYYPSRAKDCVWCALAAKNNFDMFPDWSAVDIGIQTDRLGTEEAIREILAFRFPATLDFLPRPATAPPRKGSSTVRKAKRDEWARFLGGLLLMAGAVVVFFLAAPLWFVWLGLGIWGSTLVFDNKGHERRFLKAYEDADEQVQRGLDGFMRRVGLIEVVKVRSDLDATIAAYGSIDAKLAQELTKLRATREARQLAAYLDRFSIRQAKIAGIGPAKTATLVSFGVETAADVTRSMLLRIPGFGSATAGKLMDWRRRYETEFRYDPNPNAQDIAAEKALRAKFASDKAKLEATIRSGLQTLRAAKPLVDTMPARARGDVGLLRALDERSKVEQDLKLLGVPIPRSKVALKMGPLSQGNTPASAQEAVGAVTPSAGIGTGAQQVPTCSRCGGAMVVRSGKYGRFWGCLSYPRCRGTRQI